MSPRRLRTVTLGLALAGVGIAGYLTVVRYAGLSPLCVAGGGGCEAVQTSRYAELAGIPVALLGLGGYAAIAGLSLLRGETARLLAALLAVGALAFSLYLTYLELFVIEAICQWCVASLLVATGLAIAAGSRYLGGEESSGAPGSDHEVSRAAGVR